MCWLKGVVFKSRMIWNATNKRTHKKLEFRTCLLSEVIFYPPPSPFDLKGTLVTTAGEERDLLETNFSVNICGRHCWEAVKRSPRFLVKLTCGWHVIYLLFRIHATFLENPLWRINTNTGNTSFFRSVFAEFEKKYVGISSFFAVFSTIFHLSWCRFQCNSAWLDDTSASLGNIGGHKVWTGLLRHP